MCQECHLMPSSLAWHLSFCASSTEVLVNYFLILLLNMPVNYCWQYFKTAFLLWPPSYNTHFLLYLKRVPLLQEHSWCKRTLSHQLNSRSRLIHGFVWFIFMKLSLPLQKIFQVGLKVNISVCFFTRRGTAFSRLCLPNHPLNDLCSTLLRSRLGTWRELWSSCTDSSDMRCFPHLLRVKEELPLQSFNSKDQK